MADATTGITCPTTVAASQRCIATTGFRMSLQRYGRTGSDSYGLVDDLTLTLEGNLLSCVDDAAAATAYNGGFEFRDGARQPEEYAYDENGNLVKDLNRNILFIGYNSLNLPETVRFVDGSTISYVYTYEGTKVRAVHKVNGVTTTTDYRGSTVYENGVSKLILTDDGYLSLPDKKFHYYLKDHQGNNRVVLGESGEVEEVNHYYPFGGMFAGTESVQPYKYNGKEFDGSCGLDRYDYGARRYDAALGRFTTQDAFAEKYPALSPYQYGANNPIANIDVNGDSIVVLHHSEGMHMGMLIQNDKGRWGYFSVNGDNVYSSGKFIGGRKSDDLGENEFDSPRDFFESSYNSAGDGDNPSINGYGYAEGYVIPTTPEQDAVMRETFIGISQNEEYSVLGNNCVTTVQRSMEAANLLTYDNSKTTYKVSNRQFGESSYNVSVRKMHPLFPVTSFNAIVKNNPQGYYLRRIKIR